MKKFIKKVFFYAFIILLLGNIIGFSANYFLKKSSFYKSSFLVNGFNPNEKFDYFVVGSSRGLTTLKTNKIDESLGTKGINLSMDDTDLKTQFLMIQHFFESNFKADNLVLTLDASHFTNTFLDLGNNDYRFVPYINREYVRNHFKKYEKGTLKVLFNSKFNPFFSFSYYNLELFLPAALSTIKPKFRNKFDEFGNYSYPTSGVKVDSNSKMLVSKVKITNPLINVIKNYLELNNCKLIIYIAPYKLNKYFIENDLEYSIINHSAILNKKKYLFYDVNHVNLYGSNESTRLFINNLKLFIN